MWHVEYPHKAGDVMTWKPLHSPTGETAFYKTQGEAEDHARHLSLINAQIFRVAGIGDGVVGSYIVFDYGARLIEDALTGERTRADVQMFEDIEGDDAEIWMIQSRRPHSQNNGKFSSWVDHNPREYVTLEDAVSDATRLSLQQPRKEFRVDPSPAPVVYLAGQPHPDVEQLARLCHVVTPLADAEALLLLLVEWKGVAQASALIQQLSEKVSHVSG
jgi:hypothetical protein